MAGGSKIMSEFVKGDMEKMEITIRVYQELIDSQNRNPEINILTVGFIGRLVTDLKNKMEDLK